MADPILRGRRSRLDDRSRQYAALALASPPRVEVIAPDLARAALLVQHASPAFPAELIRGAPLLVSLQPPPREPRWVVDFLAIVKRWLESAKLPEAEVLYRGRTYVIPASLDLGQLVLAAEPATGPRGGRR